MPKEPPKNNSKSTLARDLLIGTSLFIAVIVGTQSGIAINGKRPTIFDSPVGSNNKIATKVKDDSEIVLQKQNKEEVKEIDLELDKAKHLSIKTPKKNLKACAFTTSNGWKGWSVKVPGQRNLATPAISEGKLFFGGGYGSHEFYCLSAATGSTLWKYKTKDDGPSAAVVEDGVVTFGTESCTLYALDANTGKCLWKEWLGDPLMSQPAISNGRVYIAYPDGQRTTKKRIHKFLCSDLKTGNHIWEKPITADVITAPVIDGNNVYLTCLDGTSFCFDAKLGKQVWKQDNGGTSAPVITNGQCVLAKKDTKEGKTYEGLTFLNNKKGIDFFQSRRLVASGRAPYLQGSTNGTIAPQSVSKASLFKAMDSTVGFGGGAPQAAQLSKAKKHMGISSVAGAWGYQGAKAFSKKGRIMNAQGADINSIDAKTGQVRWKAKARSKSITGRSQVFSPPSLGKDNMYLVSGDGHLVAVSIKEGQKKYSYNLNQPISFQPALYKGNIYMGTAKGMMICLKTGDPDVDGWQAWGGNAQHNQNK